MAELTPFKIFHNMCLCSGLCIQHYGLPSWLANSSKFALSCNISEKIICTPKWKMSLWKISTPLPGLCNFLPGYTKRSREALSHPKVTLSSRHSCHPTLLSIGHSPFSTLVVPITALTKKNWTSLVKADFLSTSPTHWPYIVWIHLDHSNVSFLP